MNTQNKPVILMVIEGDIATTQLLEEIFSSDFFSEYDLKVVHVSSLKLADFSNGVIPVFVRCASRHSYLWVKKLVKAKVNFLYYLDDNFWRLDSDSEVGAYYKSSQVVRNLNGTIKHAHLTVVNSSSLSEYLEGINLDALLIPPVASIRADSFNNLRTLPKDKVIGGFAASQSRAGDLYQIWPVIEKMLSKHSNFYFEVIGITPTWPYDKSKVTFFNHLNDYSSYISLQLGRNWDFAIAPLDRNLGNYYKTNNKYREYASMKIPGIYEDYEPYSSVVSGHTGLKAGPSLGSWEEAFEVMIVDRHLRISISKNSIHDINENYGIEKSSTLWKEAFNQIDNSNANYSSIQQPKFTFIDEYLIPRIIYVEQKIHFHGVGTVSLKGSRYIYRKLRIMFSNTLRSGMSLAKKLYK